jgi:chromate transporter
VIFLTGSEIAFWKSLILFFTEAAFVTFGGAYAVLPFVAQVSVEKFQWLSAAQMLDGLALGETTPGPLIMVLAFVGFMAGYHQYQAGLLAGIAGLCITTWYTFLPGFFFILAGAPFIERSKDNLTLNKALSVVSAVVVGVIAGLTVYLSEKVLFITSFGVLQPDYWHWMWFIISVVALVRFKMNLIGWIGISLLMGLIQFFIEG